MKFPTIKEITEEIKFLRDYWAGEKDFDEIEVRLQVLENGNFQIHSGNAQYDTYLNGFWGASEIDLKATNKTCRKIARDLIEQVRDEFYQIKS